MKIEVECRPEAEPSRCRVARGVEMVDLDKRLYQILAHLSLPQPHCNRTIKIFTMRLKGKTIRGDCVSIP